MVNTHQVTIGSTTFNIVQADAQSQKKLLTLLGAHLSLVISASDAEEVDARLLVGNLLRLDEQKLDTVAAMVLKNVRVASDSDTIVDVKFFQNRMTDYFVLIAEAVKLNMDDFFTFVITDRNAARETARQSNSPV